jgi:hypothetical protein
MSYQGLFRGGAKMAEAERSTTLELLLREYDAVRREIEARISNRFALLALLGGALGFVLKDGWTSKRCAAVVVVVAGFLVLWLYLWHAIASLSQRQAVIEGRINDAVGPEVLSYERGRQDTFFVHPIKWVNRKVKGDDGDGGGTP